MGFKETELALATDDVAYWCETTANDLDSDECAAAVAAVTGLDNPGHVLRVAADLWLSNPDAAELRDLDEIDYVEIVKGIHAAGYLSENTDRAAHKLIDTLVARLPTKVECAARVWQEYLYPPDHDNLQIRDPQRITDEDAEEIEAYATGAHGVEMIESGDGTWLILLNR